ncbi:ABC transporter permease [Bacillus sp. FJAT-49705]|uniref:ABC transporter permease n=1 Tax=Cytobacillus citreus TaxID=2833586 RepID=A0ABS5NXX8_9BACI|nr:ABC transporter permease [Cytobacillus citreus]MBS4192680.1 ABC transporter permease [Cytobacillus citreus]
MGGLLLAKMQRFLRKPWTFIVMVLFTLVFAYFMGGNNGTQTIPIAAEGENELSSSLLEQLNTSDELVFQSVTEEELLKQVQGNEVDAGILLNNDGYRILYTVESPNVSLIEQKLTQTVAEQNERQHLLGIGEENGLSEKQVDQLLIQVEEEPLFQIGMETFHGGESVVIDSRLQGIFGLSLFFVIYTISTVVAELFEERQMGIRDRLILSPVRKWEMYSANLIYSFVLGYLQIALIFLVFRFAAKVDFYGGFGETFVALIPYVFAIVALSMFITGFVKSIRQFNALIPLISVSLAMLGGAYWPLEIVSSPFLLALSNISPISYGMEILKGVTIYQLPFSELLFPISMLLLIGVVLMGLGINGMERR